MRSRRRRAGRLRFIPGATRRMGRALPRLTDRPASHPIHRRHASRPPRSHFAAATLLRPSASASTAHTNAMATMPSARLLRPSVVPSRFDPLVALLVPSAQCAHNAPRACFSTSPARWKRDNNKNRGVSAVRATALRPRQTLSVRQKDFDKQQLPKPVEIEHKLTGTSDHGLWGFFKDQKLLQTPVDEQRHGMQHLYLCCMG